MAPLYMLFSVCGLLEWTRAAQEESVAHEEMNRSLGCEYLVGSRDSEMENQLPGAVHPADNCQMQFKEEP